MGTLALFLGQTRPVLVVWPRKRIQAAGQNRVMTPYIVVGEADGATLHPLLRLSASPPTTNRTPDGEQSVQPRVDRATRPPAGNDGGGARLQRAWGQLDCPRRELQRARRKLHPSSRRREGEDGGGQDPLRRASAVATATATTASRHHPPSPSCSRTATAAAVPPPLPRRPRRQAPASARRRRWW
jgi:hypothetical protein